MATNRRNVKMVSSWGITAASCSLADVQAAIATANAGDKVIVPAGSATWDDQLVVNKGVAIIGAGEGQTNITTSYDGSSYLQQAHYLICYNVTSASDAPFFRFSGFSIDHQSACGLFGLFAMSATPRDKIRLDHLTITNCRLFCLLYGPVYGVGDNLDITKDSPAILMEQRSLNDTIWNNHTYTFGTTDNFYFEDCEFNNVEIIMNSGWGGRYAYRHNTVSIGMGSFATWDLHGNMGPGMSHGQMGCEIYENTIYSNDYTVRTIDIRGGKSLLYNNELTGAGSYGAVIREEYDDGGNLPYHASDGLPQHIWDTYYWGNTRNGSRMPVDESVPTLDYGDTDCGSWGVTQGCHKGVVPTRNVHFWEQGASFDGSSGVGVGLKAARPETCTTGVGYWATDESKLYRATATNTWTEYYTPLAYPHPYRSDSDIGD